MTRILGEKQEKKFLKKGFVSHHFSFVWTLHSEIFAIDGVRRTLSDRVGAEAF